MAVALFTVAVAMFTLAVAYSATLFTVTVAPQHCLLWLWLIVYCGCGIVTLAVAMFTVAVAYSATLFTVTVAPQHCLLWLWHCLLRLWHCLLWLWLISQHGLLWLIAGDILPVDLNSFLYK